MKELLNVGNYGGFDSEVGKANQGLCLENEEMKGDETRLISVDRQYVK